MKNSSAKISTLVAVSGGLAAFPAAALELGEAQVQSSLGQPLRASIAYALAPNEELFTTCVSMQRGAPESALPGVGPTSITVADGVISIVGNTAIREPLVTMRVTVNCPYTANLSREYMLFIDPVSTTTAQTAAAQPAAAQTVVTAQPVAVAAPAATRRRAVNIEPVQIGARHRVQPGESLSEIAQSIEGRQVGLWAAVGAIFDANPGAFIDNDPNKLKAGSWLDIPEVVGGATASSAATIVFASEPAAAEAAPAAAATAYPGVAADGSVVESTTDVAAVDVVEDIAADVAPSDETNPYLAVPQSVGESVISIPDTQVESPAVTSTSPNAPTARIQPPAIQETSTSWLLWFAGGGIALIGALLFFGRLVRERFSSSPIGAIPAPQRRRADSDTQRIEAVSEIEVEFQELESAQENVALDADLIVGTGLQEVGEIDVAQDFGFAATAELDLELPEEMSSGTTEPSSQTDIIPPLNVEMQSILESEVLPEVGEEAEEDDYDMSVIVDATKMPMPDDVTQADLEAIPVETSDETLITGGDYTVSHEVDYKVLEQDYEDEFTATQALNNEISRAAAELAARMDEEFGDDSDSTSEMSMASVTALDITAQLPANNDDDISDLDDTGVNEAITINMKDADKTVEMASDDNTVEMPAKKGKSA